MTEDSPKRQNAEFPEGRYVNYFKIGYNEFEFILDFGQFYPDENQEAVFHTRIITCPFYSEALLKTLSDSVTRYKKMFSR
ncbi:DUF3467 domain-containing protein [Desulfonema ishimotonii]|uniref:DUF3467 domain-containing protein n=1 Tax=Desulfonema ishimotonii TaxID=45657 RepID=A0A401FTN3_9BACT|nr:DUF3467 domain-containing protein [Desulfonema ishimotonii]GBC60347.1 DUF3467 domain-containing protein [Desulfonema ishimotonii]